MGEKDLLQIVRHITQKYFPLNLKQTYFTLNVFRRDILKNFKAISDENIKVNKATIESTIIIIIITVILI